MRHIVGKLLRGSFQMYILLCVKNLSFFIYTVLSNFLFCRKNNKTHFRMNITKSYFLDLHFSTCTNQFIFICTSRKTSRVFSIFGFFDIFYIFEKKGWAFKHFVKLISVFLSFNTFPRRSMKTPNLPFTYFQNSDSVLVLHKDLSVNIYFKRE